jgi:hypothetical protein
VDGVFSYSRYHFHFFFVSQRLWPTRWECYFILLSFWFDCWIEFDELNIFTKCTHNPIVNAPSGQYTIKIKTLFFKFFYFIKVLQRTTSAKTFPQSTWCCTNFAHYCVQAWTGWNVIFIGDHGLAKKLFQKMNKALNLKHLKKSIFSYLSKPGLKMTKKDWIIFDIETLKGYWKKTTSKTSDFQE